MIRLIRYVLFLGIALCLFASCKKTDDELLNLDQVVIAYMAGNNNLRQDIENAIGRMEEGYTPKSNQRIIVYAKTDGDTSYLIEINGRGIGKSDTIRTYHQMNTSSANHLRNVLEEIKARYRAKQYSLIMSSHATSWFPSNDIGFRSFGLDQGKELSIKDLRSALTGMKFNFILFDACYMSSIEVLYELKDNAEYIIASPSEVISFGFPYEKIADLFFNGEDGLIRVCKEYLSFYDNLEGRFRSANVALIRTKDIIGLVERLKKIFIKDTSIKLQVQHSQPLIFDNSVDYEAYDLLSFIEKNFSPDEQGLLGIALSRCVLYKANTPLFNGKAVNDFCGISIYFPEKNRNNMLYNTYYSTYSFFRDSGINVLYREITGM